MPLSVDYAERVYAGVLGKLIAVYLGRLFEGWTYEQIGAQIFIDGWAMVAPGDPSLTADLAGRAASVSPDGEAIYVAQVIAAMESMAFVERDLSILLDTAVSFIPKSSIIYRLIADIRHWHAGEPDWRKSRERIAAHYGYDKYGGNCHIVPNHALIILALLYGGDDFAESLMIVNTSGWDTDCNSGNVGCLMGIKNGLTGITPALRDPIADRLYLPTADGGRAITDVGIEVMDNAQNNGVDYLDYLTWRGSPNTRLWSSSTSGGLCGVAHG